MAVVIIVKINYFGVIISIGYFNILINYIFEFLLIYLMILMKSAVIINFIVDFDIKILAIVTAIILKI